MITLSKKLYMDILKLLNCDCSIQIQTYKMVFDRSIDICRVGFEIRNIYPDLLEAVKGGYTLIINLVHIPMRGNPTTGMSTAVAASSSTYASSEQFKFVFEKLFLRNLEKPSVPCHEKLKLRDTGRQCTATQVATASTFTNPFSVIFRKLFTRFNPCAANTDPILNFHSSRRSRSVRSPVDRAIIIRSQQCQEIKAAFRLIHESACKNWIAASEENFKYTPEVQQQFREMCEEIERKGEEGRKGLMDKVSKDIERTKQWDHVLGPKTLENLRITKEKEVELKVQHFCKRKVTEAREKIAEEIRQQRLRMKTRFYREILDEQMMELLRLKEKYQQKI